MISPLPNYMAKRLLQLRYYKKFAYLDRNMLTAPAYRVYIVEMYSMI